MRALICSLFASLAKAHTATVEPDQQVIALVSHIFACSARAQTASVLVGTKVGGAELASVRLVVLGSARHCVGKHDN